MPFSATLLEPTVTYSVRQSRSGDDVLGPVMIQRPARQVGASFTGAARIRVAAPVRGILQRIGVGDIEILADQRHAGTASSALQEHRARFGRRLSLSASRSSVMRLALGVAAGALHEPFHDPALQPWPSSGFGGASVSATSTSPFGSTYSQRRMREPSAKAARRAPAPAPASRPAASRWPRRRWIWSGSARTSAPWEPRCRSVGRPRPARRGLAAAGGEDGSQQQAGERHMPRLAAGRRGETGRQASADPAAMGIVAVTGFAAGPVPGHERLLMPARDRRAAQRRVPPAFRPPPVPPAPGSRCRSARPVQVVGQHVQRDQRHEFDQLIAVAGPRTTARSPGPTAYVSATRGARSAAPYRRRS